MWKVPALLDCISDATIKSVTIELLIVLLKALFILNKVSFLKCKVEALNSVVTYDRHLQL